MSTNTRDRGSYKDPYGQVHIINGRVFRTIMTRAKDDFDYVRNKPFLTDLIAQGKIISEARVEPNLIVNNTENIYTVLEHPKIDFISYPYEWPFPALKAAAILHLDLHISALEQDITLSDASAYNIQFVGPNPIFIDSLSFRQYATGEYWGGHRQFCEQFINPLLLRSLLGIEHNSWYRGSLDGITASDLNAILTLRMKCSWNVFTHVSLQARFQSRKSASTIAQQQLAKRNLSKPAYIQILKGLRSWIRRLEPKNQAKTTWEDYAEKNSYAAEDADQKGRFIAEFCNSVKPHLLYDYGCNTGHYAEIALNSGANSVIGFDNDQGALDRSYVRATTKKLHYLPLYMDAANPSPSQGWFHEERASLNDRANADGVLALALIHHLAIGKNVPLDEAIRWITESARQGIIEFIPKSDPMVQELLKLRSDIFTDYTTENFERILAMHSNIIKFSTASSSDRRLYWFSRH